MDDLTRIKGIGKAAAKRLAEAGIETFAQLAAIEDGEDSRAEQIGVKAVWNAEAAQDVAQAATSVAEQQDTQGKPPRPDEQGGSAEARPIPADSGAGDPQQDKSQSEGRGGGSGDPAVPARERRRFPVNWALMHDGRLVEESGKVELTLVEHQKLVGGVVSAPWLSGESVE